MNEQSTNIYLQVLAVDLLNPSPAAEARKHKLKVLAFPRLLSSLSFSSLLFRTMLVPFPLVRATESYQTIKNLG